jgi:hypothetical protein
MTFAPDSEGTAAMEKRVQLRVRSVRGPAGLGSGTDGDRPVGMGHEVEAVDEQLRLIARVVAERQRLALDAGAEG